jgi:hypothetical protein
LRGRTAVLRHLCFVACVCACMCVHVCVDVCTVGGQTRSTGHTSEMCGSTVVQLLTHDGAGMCVSMPVVVCAEARCVLVCVLCLPTACCSSPACFSPACWLLSSLCLLVLVAATCCCRYLSQYPRLLYFRRQLVEYNKLFGGQMEAWVAAGEANNSAASCFIDL